MDSARTTKYPRFSLYRQTTDQRLLAVIVNPTGNRYGITERVILIAPTVYQNLIASFSAT